MTDTDSNKSPTVVDGDVVDGKGVMARYAAIRDAVVREFVAGASIYDLANRWNLSEALILEMLSGHMK